MIRRADGWLLRMAAASVGMWLAGCPGGDSEPADGMPAARPPCDPLMRRERPVELGTLLGAGRDTDGTLYVVDQENPSSAARLFVSDDDVLVLRGSESGTGRTAGGVDQYMLLGTRDGMQFRVLLERKSSGVRMKLIDGEAAMQRELDFDRAQGTELEVAEASALKGKSVRADQFTFRVEYNARIDGEARLIVTAPEEVVDFDAYRLFYGPPDAVDEREVTKFLRYRDGGSTEIQFDLDGDTARAFFPNKIDPSSSTTMGPVATIMDPVTFEIDGESHEIAPIPRDAPELEGVTFKCLR